MTLSSPANSGFCFGIIRHMSALIPVQLVRSITPTFISGVQYNLLKLFSIVIKCATSNICSDKSKVKVTLQG